MEQFRDVNSFEKWKKLAEAQDFRCIYCGFDFLASPENYASSEIDHLRPKSNGGEEVVLACCFCNMVKRNEDCGKEGEAREDIIEKAREHIKGKREEYLKKYEYEELKRMHRTVRIK